MAQYSNGRGLCLTREPLPRRSRLMASAGREQIDFELIKITSARNKFAGKVSRIVPGAVNTDVTLDVGGGKSVCALITNISATDLGLKEGELACALFKAPSVILLKDD